MASGSAKPIWTFPQVGTVLTHKTAKIKKWKVLRVNLEIRVQDADSQRLRDW